MVCGIEQIVNELIPNLR